MKFALQTKHLHFALAYRDPDEDELSVVDNTGGDFQPAGTDPTAEGDETLQFGYQVTNG